MTGLPHGAASGVTGHGVPLVGLFEANAARHPARAAVTLDGVTVTYGALNGLADSYAARLHGLGLGAGDRVVVYADLSLDVVAAALGILKAGACLVTTHPTFSRRKLVRQTRACDAAVLVTDRAGVLGDLFADTGLSAVLPLGAGGPPGEPRPRPCPLGRPRKGPGIPVVGPPAAVFYTSGSTSSPKGVTIGHRAMTAALEAVTSSLGHTADDVVLSCTPIGSDFGFYNVVLPLAFGGRVVLLRGLGARPREVWETIGREGVTAVHGFPSLLAHLCRIDGLGRDPRPSLRLLASTGQRLPAEHIRTLREALPDVPIHSMYGLTECKRVCALPPEEIDRRPGSVGRPVPGVRAHLVDGAGAPVEGPGVTGELVVAGDQVMQGYWGDPELTGRVLRTGLFGEDRVLFTGDLFTRDEDGFLSWVARGDDTFSRSMFKVNPHEVEARLRQHPSVADAAVVPVPDEEAGEVPAACVVPRDSHPPDAEELRRHCAEHLDWHMVPALVVFRDGLPRTESGKTDRRALRRALTRPAPGPVDGGAGEYVASSSMIGLADHFDAIATGRDQVPRVPVRSTIRGAVTDHLLLEYQDAMVERSGPLFRHFLASVPGVLEELSRVGVALARLAGRRAQRDGHGLTFYEADAFDGSNGRTLAAFADGRVTTLTSSPNRANERWFRTWADPARSRYFPGSLFHLDRAGLRAAPQYEPFRDGFDVVYETAAFQFYGKDRAAQIEHLTEVLKPGGLAFFLEKLNHPDPLEYERRERVKDEVHKARYFTAEEIGRKRQEMLTRMVDGQVEFDDLVGALGDRFSHVHLLWNGTNFYEFVAGDDAGTLAEFLELAGQPFIPDGFCFEDPVVRRVGGHGGTVTR
ncbi:AMP-binding protein [Streptomyces sp. NPDC057236]|uniref:AMP-binding protein n=1 Tax=Streptomyces sp. NPDC057236 TaxID=3346059 RepID=UPI0036275BC6